MFLINDTSFGYYLYLKFKDENQYYGLKNVDG